MKSDELTRLAIDWLSGEYPDAVIVTEMSVADWGNARIDVAAITDDEIIGVEIKGEGDSPTRLELQGLRYGQVARKMWLLPTPDGTLADRCRKKKPDGWGNLEVWQGSVRPMNTAKKLGPKQKTKHGYSWPRIPDPDNYRPSQAAESQSLNPWAMCGTLWRDELAEIVRLNKVPIKGRALVNNLSAGIVDHMPVPRLHDLMIIELRRRVWRKKVIDLRIRTDAKKDLFR